MFKLIPEKDRFQAFKDLEIKDIEAFNLIPDNERFVALEYMDRESINILKIMVSKGDNIDNIFKNSNQPILNKL